MSDFDDKMEKVGGPAFPIADEAGFYYGMSLRDWFAGQTLPFFLSSGAWDDYEDMAKSAYSIADAMLAESAKGQK